MALATHGNTGLKIIVFMGMGTFLFLMLVMFGLRQSFKPQENLRVPAGEASSPFEESRAWTSVDYLVGLGPRSAGSKAMEAQRSYITRELRTAGLKVQMQQFEAETPRGAIPMANVIGKIEGNRPGVVVLSGHYDTRHVSEFPLVGANSGAASTAWLLEMARAIGPRREGRSIWIVFFDGEQAQSEQDANALRGSRHFVEELEAAGTLDEIHAAINIAMVGDCYLSVNRDPGAPRWLGDVVWNTARRHGYQAHFGRNPADIKDSHTRFRIAGVPALELIDFSYGGSRLDHGRNWNTAEDTIDKVCPGSLRAVGDVIYHALPVIEGQLDTMNARADGN